ncbi:hypothetical protein [Agromyces sp. NPDC058110]
MSATRSALVARVARAGVARTEIVRNRRRGERRMSATPAQV